MKIVQNFIVLFLFLSGIGCEESESVNTEPNNLVVEVAVDEENFGEVEITAIAENTVAYHFYNGLGETEPEVNETGLFTQTYLQPGIYTIEIWAYGTSGRYMKKEKQVIIELGDETIDPEDGYITPPSYEGMTLAWSDEFDGTTLNLSDWTYEIGTGSNGWGNNELQYYTENNTKIENGILTIEAKQESEGGSSYTSSRIITQGKQSFQYGRIDIRAVLPKGQGIWPALWMLGSNFSTAGWPSCGEIDIMEMVGGSDSDNVVHGTVHWDHNGGYASYGNSNKLESGIFADEYHVFSIIWTESKITWLRDDVVFNVIDTSPSGLDEFRQEFFLIFNVAVGGNWPGSPDGTTLFPQKMMVDYVRVFQEN